MGKFNIVLSAIHLQKSTRGIITLMVVESIISHYRVTSRSVYDREFVVNKQAYCWLVTQLGFIRFGPPSENQLSKSPFLDGDDAVLLYRIHLSW